MSKHDIVVKPYTKAHAKSIAEHFSTRGVEIIQICAESKNEIAIKAYERIGFSQIGILENGLKYSKEEYSDEVMMAAPIDLLLDKK